MRPFLTTLAVLAAATSIHALAREDYLSATENFIQQYLSPNNEKVAHSINSTLFAENVTGTVDILRTSSSLELTTSPPAFSFDGRELATEYLFGFFVGQAKDATDPSPYGIPVSYKYSALMIQEPYVQASVKFGFYYPVLNTTVPVQIDIWFLFNDNLEVQQYDLVLRRAAWAFEDLAPYLTPFMAARLSLPQNTSQPTILRSYFTQKICSTALSYCNGTNQQYSSFEDCEEQLGGKDLGEWFRAGDDNLVCRNLHVPMVPLRPQVHCEHVGPSGGDMCIPRNYSQVVLDEHFPAGFLAQQPHQVSGDASSSPSSPSPPTDDDEEDGDDDEEWKRQEEE
ncbi:hypothetical protein L198_00710 [Cryptococcus wingfieldii CBS 7118]|uniref:Uncharacterized protein n=1 Tax=Cryptococcus wingfieldii CBS 7118 TaxID=1295528 RepID=A0A1E3K755_9TREE|nr:hypothetical protein L198_00710 [Cryptococcus wingfieldii CBS 7118]ODO08970.1 hypothetical protein L198_00710 [Cryptococcus wingfieldii CBS 7118]